jgi:hypothetical protein
MKTGTKLNSSALLLVGAVGGGLVTPQLMTGTEGQTLPVAFDMASKRVIVEVVIGATDGLRSTGWENPALETRVDQLRVDEHRMEVEAYEGVRSATFEEAVAGQWTEMGLTSYLNALEIESDHLYPIAIMASTSQRSVTDLISENHDWMIGKPSDLIGLSRLLELETGIQYRVAHLPEEEIWSSASPIGAQAYLETPYPLHQGFAEGMDDPPDQAVKRTRVEILELGSVVVSSPFDPEPDPTPSF